MLLLLSLAIVLGCIAPAQEQPSEPNETADIPEVQISISVVSAPETAKVGEAFSMTWMVSGPEKTIPHTAIHYDFASHPGDFDTSVAPGASGYPGLTQEFASGQFQVPDTFTASITVEQAGTLHYRAHAIVDGMHYWTAERTLTVSEAETPDTGGQLKEFTIEADDNGFYPSGTVNVNAGDTVRITFVVLEDTTYFGGLDFRSSAWGDTGKVSPGASTTVEFVADNTFQFRSYWPSSNVLKATGTVNVS